MARSYHLSLTDAIVKQIEEHPEFKLIKSIPGFARFAITQLLAKPVDVTAILQKVADRQASEIPIDACWTDITYFDPLLNKKESVSTWLPTPEAWAKRYPDLKLLTWNGEQL